VLQGWLVLLWSQVSIEGETVDGAGSRLDQVIDGFWVASIREVYLCEAANWLTFPLRLRRMHVWVTVCFVILLQVFALILDMFEFLVEPPVHVIFVETGRVGYVKNPLRNLLTILLTSTIHLPIWISFLTCCIGPQRIFKLIVFGVQLILLGHLGE